ncbi:hypothetical protein B1H10_00585 [candidate division KSB1 bacterium 4484_188]|nr:MAG: hypothetical protein B1H10_00585 [candidate division KSB1 bacterium 4484_188]
MERKNKLRFGLILIGIGIIIGLIISAGFDFTKPSDANPSALPPASQSSVQDTAAQAGIQALDQLSNAFASIAEKVRPSVVTIFTETTIKSKGIQMQPFGDMFGDEFFRQFFGIPPGGQPREYKQHGLGSGVIVSPDGIIITNNHVVAKADDIKVRLIDGTEYKAKVKGKDKRTDLAILKIDAKNLPAIKIGDSDKLRVGAWVLAIGSPLSPELAHTVTSGIVSAKGRSGIGLGDVDEDYIQTDAAINPGNSGGALVNIHGELVGINAAIATRNGGFMGIGFAIPSNLAHKVMTDILEKGRVLRGWLGVYIQDINENIAKGLGLEKPQGVLISSVQEDSPAEKAGLKTEDVVLAIDGRKVRNSSELRARVAAAGPGKKVTLKILRDGKEKEIKVTLGEYPEEQATAAVESKAAEKIGIKVSNITPNLVQKFDLKVRKNGVVITNIKQGSVAVQSGLRPGDVILKINRKQVKNVSDYNKVLEKVKPGDTILFYIQRNEAKIFIAFTIPKE